jgi:hypothetical protein
MIKTMGFGRRRESLSHEDCINHHRETHSKLGQEQAAHLGKYVMYYFSEALSGSGSAIGDLPWDMAEVAWIDDERWKNFRKWQAEEPDGQAIKADEEQFLDREKCYLVVCDEKTIIDSHADAKDVSVVRVLRLRAGADPSTAIRAHRDLLVPVIKDAFGSSLKTYVTHYVTETMNLAHGLLPVGPIDIVERYRIDQSIMRADDQPFRSARVVDCEASILDREGTLMFRGEEVVYI